MYAFFVPLTMLPPDVQGILTCCRCDNAPSLVLLVRNIEDETTQERLGGELTTKGWLTPVAFVDAEGNLKVAMGLCSPEQRPISRTLELLTQLQSVLNTQGELSIPEWSGEPCTTT